MARDAVAKKGNDSRQDSSDSNCESLTGVTEGCPASCSCVCWDLAYWVLTSLAALRSVQVRWRVKWAAG